MTRYLEDVTIPGADVGGSPDGPDVRVMACPRRVRATFAGVTIADSTDVRYVFERDHLPVYYFPEADVDGAHLERSATTTDCPRKGRATYWSIRVGDRLVEDAVWGYEDPIPEAAELAGLRALYWNKLDHWYEEDDEVFVHPRDPNKRIDVLPSSRHVRVEIDGVEVADSHHPHLLFETGLPTRYYLPRFDVHTELLRDSDTVTGCPYKGRASYYSVAIGDRLVPDVAWTYPFPIPEAPRLEQLIAFYNEQVDIFVDGEQRPRPQTHWS